MFQKKNMVRHAETSSFLLLRSNARSTPSSVLAPNVFLVASCPLWFCPFLLSFSTSLGNCPVGASTDAFRAVRQSAASGPAHPTVEIGTRVLFWEDRNSVQEIS